MAAVNFKTVNGKQLQALLAGGGDVPVNLPTVRNISEGDIVKFTYGDRYKPVTIADVVIKHSHVWQTDGGPTQNLIVTLA